MRPAINQSIVFTYTDDLDRAAEFFGGIMELPLVRDQGACRIYRLTETSLLGVCDLPDRPKDPAGVTITLVTDDVEGWYAFLRGKGVDFAEAPASKAQFGITTSLLISPHGYRIEIQSFDVPLR